MSAPAAPWRWATRHARSPGTAAGYGDKNFGFMQAARHPQAESPSLPTARTPIHGGGCRR